MAFSDVLGQEQAIQLLKNAIQRQRVPSAWLFCGKHHVGKFTTAEALAQTLNCEQPGDDACGQCRACRQIQAQTHPDYQVLNPEGKEIKIDQIREIKDWLHLRAVSGKHRVLVVTEAERLRLEAANAFLKILEEPPLGTIMVLLAESPQQLLETLVSRCQIIRFQPLSREHLTRILQQLPDVSLTPEQISFLANFGMGQLRSDWITSLAAIQTLRAALAEMLLSLSKAAMDDVLQKVNQWLDAKDQQWTFMLDFMEYWFRDCAWLLQGLPHEQLLNGDYADKLQIFAQRHSPQRLSECYSLVISTREAIDLNVNKLLALESLWIQLRQRLGT